MNSSQWKTCPDCGQPLQSAAHYCWLCFRPLTDPSEDTTPRDGTGAAEPATFVGGRLANQLALSTLMLTITLVPVLLGVFILAPGLGVLLFLIILPAYLRTCLQVSRRGINERPMSPGDTLSTFVTNVGVTVAVIVAVVVAGIVALVAVCFASLGGSTIFP